MKSGRRTAAAIVMAIIVLVALLFILVWWMLRAGRVSKIPSADLPGTEKAGEKKDASQTPRIASVAKKLEVPWSLDFLPDGSIVCTERIGRIRLIDAEKGLDSKPLVTIDDVADEGEGGLLGIAVHPEFSRNHLIFVYYTYRTSRGLANKVASYRMQKDKLVSTSTIIDQIPGNSIHNGGRIKFGPDGFLYICTGDAGQPELAQDKNSLAGKILRLTDKGEIPEDNPFPGSPVYSLGHRNPQGLAWDDQGQLWETEHGSAATDEVNLINPGSNYGWPLIRGNEQAKDLRVAAIHSGTETWAPSGLAFWDDSLFFAGLRSQTLFRLVINDEQLQLQRELEEQFGRLRDVVVGPDGLLYVLTSNRDGRGLPTEDDDRIIQVNPRKL